MEPVEPIVIPIITMAFNFDNAVAFALAPVFAGVFVAFVLSALDVFLPHRGALDKKI